MLKPMLKTMLALRARIDQLTTMIQANKEYSRRIAITIEDMQGKSSTRQASRDGSEDSPEKSDLQVKPSPQLPPV
jgi:hypothetical protein